MKIKAEISMFIYIADVLDKLNC